MDEFSPADYVSWWWVVAFAILALPLLALVAIEKVVEHVKGR